MIDINLAYVRAKKALNRFETTMLDDIFYYLEFEDNYIFFSGSDIDEYKKGNVIIVNKKGGKVSTFNYYNYCLINKNIDTNNLISINEITNNYEDEDKNEFDFELLEKRESLNISKRDLIYNLVEKDIPFRTILKIDQLGITLNNINKMSLIDFATVFGQSRQKVYSSIKELSKNSSLGMNNISIYVLGRFGISETLCKNLYDSGIDKFFKLYFIPKEVFYTEYNFHESTVEKFYNVVEESQFQFSYDHNIDEFIKNIENKDNFQKYLMSEIQTKISQYPDGIKLFTLKKIIDKRYYKCSCIDNLIQKMIAKKTIKLNEIGLVANQISIKDYLDYLPDSPNNKLLKKYLLENVTYESLSDELGVSRQRIEQRLSKCRLPEVYEDRYSEFYKTYNVYENEFCTILGVEPYIYKYINYKYKRNKNQLSVESLFDEDNLPEYIKKNLEKLYFNSYLFIEGEKIPKTKKMLVTYYMKQNIHELTGINDIVNGFKLFIENFVPDYNKGTGRRDVEGALTIDNVPVVSSIHATYKYYDINNVEIKEFLKELNLEQYKDIELSSLYLFNLHRELMEEFNIDNEYVLHNLLRKVYKKSYVSYQRTPYIIFGNGNRDKQLDNLVLELAPVKCSYFIKEYCKRYGAEENFMAVEIYKKYKDIIIDHYITLEDEYVLSVEEIEKIKMLTNGNSLIFKEDLNFKLKGMNIDIDRIYTKNNLMALGYVSNSNYIYSKNYSSMTEYLEKKYFEKDIIDLTILDKRLLYSSLFYEMLNNKRKNLKIIEFENGKFINSNVLKKIDVEIEHIQDFVNHVNKFTFGKGIFTIKSIVNQGFEHELLGLGFDDMFYSSILRSNTKLNYKRLKNTIIFENSSIKHEISVTNILEELLLRYRKMEEYELVEYLNDHYGLDYNENVWDLQKYIKETNIYYDRYTDTYYYNYDVYFEEV